jgi:uncharacterized protein (TIRG00374 family)
LRPTARESDEIAAFRLSRARAKWLHRAFSVAIALLAFYWVSTRIDLRQTWQHLLDSNYAWFFCGFGAFYLSLPLRAWRWQLLLANLGTRVPLARLMSVIFRAWTVNCALPGRAGDLYGAYVLHAEHGLEGTKTLGTIFSARVLDLLTLIVLVALMFILNFQQQFPPVFGRLIVSALGLGVLVTVGLLGLHKLRGATARLLPQRLVSLYERFLQATFASLRNVPVLVLITLALWLLEAFRLWCVLGAIGAPRPLAPVMFLALAAAVLTTLPITPGGLGTVEALYQQFLPHLGVSASAAASVAILDRIINYWFILVAGALYFIIRREKIREGVSLDREANR